MLAPQRERGIGLGLGRGFYRCTKFVLLDLQGGFSAFEACDTSARNKFERSLVVELRRPTDGQLHAPTGQEHVFAGEEDAGTAHIDSSSDASFIGISFAEDFVADFAFDGESISGPPICFLCIGLQSSPPTANLRPYAERVVADHCPIGQQHRSFLMVSRGGIRNNRTSGSFLIGTKANTLRYPKLVLVKFSCAGRTVPKIGLVFSTTSGRVLRKNSERLEGGRADNAQHLDYTCLSSGVGVLF